MPSHYLNQCWDIVNWTLRNMLQWNLNRNSNMFIEEYAFENIIWKMAVILSQCVKWWLVEYSVLNHVLNQWCFFIDKLPCNDINTQNVISLCRILSTIFNIVIWMRNWFFLFNMKILSYQDRIHIKLRQSHDRLISVEIATHEKIVFILKCPPPPPPPPISEGSLSSLSRVK